MKRRRFIQAAAAGLGGGLAGCGLQLPLPALQERKTRPGVVVARGSVRGPAGTLAGVRVSDGVRVVTTDPSGRFEIELERDSGPFIFVVTPSGLWTDRFWAPIQSVLDGPIDFTLEAMSQPEDFQFVFLTDIHLGEGPEPRRSLRKFADTLDEISRQAPAPAFLWFGGDMTIARGWGPRFLSMARGIGLPFRCLAGDHELHDHRPDPHAEYHFFFGPSHYSFDWGRVHFIALDGLGVERLEDGRRRVRAELSARELAWLEEDLQMVPAGMPSVVAAHVPIATTYPRRRGLSAEQASSWVFHNAADIIKVLSRYNVHLVLQGHLHENERLRIGDIEFVETVAVAGRWWRSAGRELGVSGEPRGYRRVLVRGLRMWHDYVTSAESKVEGIGEVVGLPEVLPRAAEVPILLNLYDGCNDARVSARLDEGKWTPLALAEPVGEFEGARMAHHWLWSLDTREWSSGAHLLQFRIQEVDRQDRLLEHRVELL